MEEVDVEVARQALPSVKRDAADVLRVDRGRDVVRDDRATATCAHDRDQHISGVHFVALELPILFWCDEPALPPAKLISHGVVDA